MSQEYSDFSELEDLFGVSNGEAFYYYCKNFHINPSFASQDDADACEYAFIGIYSSIEEYATEMAEHMGVLKDMGNLSVYFDTKSFARDLVLGGDIWVEETDSGVFVYGNY